MSQPLPRVSVIIAAPPDMAEVKAVSAAKRLDYPSDRLEIILARGRQPSVQRNAALREASGEWVYFLDDDALPMPDNLRRAAGLFEDRAVAMVGGPNLCPPDAPLLEQVFAVVLSSWLAFGPSRARYAGVGERRNAGEKELILCNLIARREPVLSLGGFDEALYPNEENALMDGLQQQGFRLVYDPGLVVRRRPRRSISAFLRMLRTYGRGRAEQFRRHPTTGSLLNFVPPLFCLYLVLLAVASAVAPLQAVQWAALPLAFYLLAAVGQTAVSMGSSGMLLSLMALPFLMASHVLYGLGFWHGLFTKFRSGAARSPVAVRVEKFAP